MAGTRVVDIAVDAALCKGCSLCIEVCPRGVLSVSGVRGAQGSLLVAASAPERCTECRVCELICPDLAIVVGAGDEA